MEFRAYPDREMMFMELADELASELGNCLRTHEHASFCVPGGSTPGPIFDVLSDVALDWSRVHVFLNDERWVPESSDRSNTRLLRERLLIGRAAKAKLIPMVADVPEPEDALDHLSAGFADELPISVLLLGMGTDMHTASLFPGADRLDDALAPGAPTLMAMRAPGAPEPRVTLTAHVLDGAMSKHVVVTGSEKREAIERARSLSRREAPITAVWNGAVVHWAE